MAKFEKAVMVATVVDAKREIHGRPIENCPWLNLREGILKNKTNSKYVVDLVDKRCMVTTKGLVVEESALGIPVTAIVNDGKTEISGVVTWNADFNAKKLQICTESGQKTAETTNIKRIESWKEIFEKTD